MISWNFTYDDVGDLDVDKPAGVTIHGAESLPAAHKVALDHAKKAAKAIPGFNGRISIQGSDESITISVNKKV